MTAIVTALAVVVAILGAVVALLAQSHRALLQRLDLADAEMSRQASSTTPAHTNGRRKAVGSVVPPIVGRTLGGEPVTREFSQTRRTLIAYLSSSCHTCATFWNQFRAVSPVNDDLDVVIVTKDARSEQVEAITDLAPPGVDVVLSSASWDAVDVPGSPWFVSVAAGTSVIDGAMTATTWRQLSRALQLPVSGNEAASPTGTPHRTTAGYFPGDPRLS